ncbi:hypothetical protein, partial [Arthrobacter sp.]|uniref:hypothetical protein n=1 Tax=Arthrobacter sp. TaxID=1667 RepID=UPI0028A25D3C
TGFHFSAGTGFHQAASRQDGKLHITNGLRPALGTVATTAETPNRAKPATGPHDAGSPTDAPLGTWRA